MEQRATIQPTTWPRELIWVIVGMLFWLTAMSVGSVFVSVPFHQEASAGAAIQYPATMYLHGLLIGMVGLLALVTLHVFRCEHHGLHADAHREVHHVVTEKRTRP